MAATHWIDGFLLPDNQTIKVMHIPVLQFMMFALNLSWIREVMAAVLALNLQNKSVLKIRPTTDVRLS